MGRITKTLLATTLAVGGMFAAAAPASASGDLVDVTVGDVVILNDVTVEVAAVACGILDVNALIEHLNQHGEADCLGIADGKIIKN
ncbi:hypothetical protein [Micromonospora sagamiensis]|uniref:Uncharacterized protein n=1 Tax=Micromonospora sagamiensis TaxID=47875 RepID=A0A562WN63_9ACTN|nr:hypothetical protein [Micromonospora sagamiensis]TWJ31626.1 hypothetical protein JD81_05185 [Micromonospora sagamiensis]BCL15321.1 hypothetical protein GCM10017556_30600 [Micromonospora sagamiensis]